MGTGCPGVVEGAGASLVATAVVELAACADELVLGAGMVVVVVGAVSGEAVEP